VDDTIESRKEIIIVKKIIAEEIPLVTVINTHIIIFTQSIIPNLINLENNYYIYIY
jgi:hypothetical protein